MISILVATKNRPNQLLNCLKSISKNKNIAFEVIVVDQSSNPSVEIQKTLKFFPKAQYWHFPEGGKTQALNFGLSKVNGDIVAFTDDDCVVAADWLREIQKSFDQKDCDAVFGQTLPHQPKKHPGLFCPSTNIFNKKQFIRAPKNHSTQIGFGNNMAFSKKVLNEIGQFKEWLGPGSIATNADDAEITLRALLLKKTILRNPRLVVYHDRWLTEKSLKIQDLSYIKGGAACYSYFAFQGHLFAKSIVLKEIYKNFSRVFKSLNKLFSKNKTNREKFGSLYWSLLFLFANLQGICIGLYFFLKNSL